MMERPRGQYYGFGLSEVAGQLEESSGDDTALNDVDVVCCTAKAATAGRHFLPEGESTGGRWGQWYDLKLCNPGAFAYGFKLRVEEPAGGGDDTALNGVRLACRGPGGADAHEIRAKSYGEGHWGQWGSYATCAAGEYLVGFDIRVEDPRGDGDDTAANDLQFRCSNGRVLLASNGGKWGAWRPGQYCRNGYVCGFRTRVEAPRGDGDDTALNDVAVVCCGDG